MAMTLEEFNEKVSRYLMELYPRGITEARVGLYFYPVQWFEIEDVLSALKSYARTEGGFSKPPSPNFLYQFMIDKGFKPLVEKSKPAGGSHEYEVLKTDYEEYKKKFTDGKYPIYFNPSRNCLEDLRTGELFGCKPPDGNLEAGTLKPIGRLREVLAEYQTSSGKKLVSLNSKVHSVAAADTVVLHAKVYDMPTSDLPLDEIPF